MNVEVSDSLNDVTQEFGEFERRNRLYLDDTLNEFGYRELCRQAEQLETALERVNSDSKFDELVLRDMEYNLKASTEYADFLRRETDYTVDEMFDLLYGEGAFENLEEEALSYEDKANYQARELMDQLVFDDPWKYELDIKKMAFNISDQIESGLKMKV